MTDRWGYVVALPTAGYYNEEIWRRVFPPSEDDMPDKNLDFWRKMVAEYSETEEEIRKLSLIRTSRYWTNEEKAQHDKLVQKRNDLIEGMGVEFPSLMARYENVRGRLRVTQDE